MIVIVVVCVPFSVAPPPETVAIAIIPVSFGSNVVSSVGVNEVVPVVEPAVCLL